MAVELDHMDEGASPGAARLLMRAAQAEARSRGQLAASIGDFLIPDDARLDERTRVAVATILARIVGQIESVVLTQANSLLIERHDIASAASLDEPVAPALSRLIESGLASDPELMGELLGRARLETLAVALPFTAHDGGADAQTLLARLTAGDDIDAAQAARDLFNSENRRRTGAGGDDLPAELYHRMVWRIAAILRERLADPVGAGLDQALADAAAYALGRHDESARVETAATRVAATLDARGRELAALLERAMAERRVTLFVALIGYACGLSFEDAREFVLDPAGDRLWVALRAMDMPHDTIARLAVALAEADPRRDLEAFADNLDDIAALDAGAARASFASLRAPSEYRAALDALGRSQ